MEKILHINGQPVLCRITGAGLPVMLVHGFGVDGRLWENQVPILEKKFMVIVPDLPGSAQSGLPASVSMEALADSLRQILDELQIPACVMIGHSMGGYVTLAFAEKYPGRLKAFGLFHSGGYADNEEKITTRRRGIQFINEQGVVKFLEQANRNLFSDEFKTQHPDTVQEIIERFTNFLPQSLVSYYEAMIQRPDRTAILKKFGKPVLFILGKYDKAIPLDQGLEQCYLPVLSFVHILNHSAHLGMLEEATTSTGLLENFLMNYEIE